MQARRMILSCPSPSALFLLSIPSAPCRRTQATRHTPQNKGRSRHFAPTGGLAALPRSRPTPPANHIKDKDQKKVTPHLVMAVVCLLAHALNAAWAAGKNRGRLLRSARANTLALPRQCDTVALPTGITCSLGTFMERRPCFKHVKHRGKGGWRRTNIILVIYEERKSRPRKRGRERRKTQKRRPGNLTLVFGGFEACANTATTLPRVFNVALI